MRARRLRVLSLVVEVRYAACGAGPERARRREDRGQADGLRVELVQTGDWAALAASLPWNFWGGLEMPHKAKQPLHKVMNRAECRVPPFDVQVAGLWLGSRNFRSLKRREAMAGLHSH